MDSDNHPQNQTFFANCHKAIYYFELFVVANHQTFLIYCCQMFQNFLFFFIQSFFIIIWKLTTSFIGWGFHFYIVSILPELPCIFVHLFNEIAACVFNWYFFKMLHVFQIMNSCSFFDPCSIICIFYNDV